MPIIVLFIALVSALIGAGMAQRRGRSSIAWGIFCFFFPLIGLLILKMTGRTDGTDRGRRDNPWVQTPIGSKLAHREVASPKYDVAKWEALRSIDPEIDAAGYKAFSISAECEDELATKYLALMDKKYLPVILEKVISAHS